MTSVSQMEMMKEVSLHIFESSFDCRLNRNACNIASTWSGLE